ncbi:MAG: type II secretion system F family protein [Candidatus Pacearchaeota archaeon]
MKIQIRYILIVIGSLIVISSFFIGPTDFKKMIILLGLLIGFLPLVIEKSLLVKKEREKEEKFLEFLQDIIEGVKTGTPINKMILLLEKKNYSSLTPHIKKLASQIYLGIPLTQALTIFAQDTGNETIKRFVELISEANRSGGEITDILSSAANSLNQMEVIKKERKSSISSIVVQGYIIFFVFIGIIIFLQFFLFPLISSVNISDLNLEVNPQRFDFSTLTFWLIVVQSFFTGIVIGMIAEGRAAAGLKHSFILISTSLFIISIAEIIF